MKFSRVEERKVGVGEICIACSTQAVNIVRLARLCLTDSSPELVVASRDSEEVAGRRPGAAKRGVSGTGLGGIRTRIRAEDARLLRRATPKRRRAFGRNTCLEVSTDSRTERRSWKGDAC